jgi:hypothetical protein
VGRPPRTAADAPSAFVLSVLAEPDQGVRRGRERPPHARFPDGLVTEERGDIDAAALARDA